MANRYLKGLFALVCIACAAVSVHAATMACSPPTLPPNSNFVVSANCSGTYETVTQHCRCWGHCGYICEPKGSQTCQPANANGPATKPPGFTWIKDPGCTLGDGPGQVLIGKDGNTNRCTCYAFCGYICNPDGSSGAPSQ